MDVNRLPLCRFYKREHCSIVYGALEWYFNSISTVMTELAGSGMVGSRRSANRRLLNQIIVLACFFTGAQCGKWQERLPRGMKDLHLAMNRPQQPAPYLGHCNFEDICDWSWNKTLGFAKVTSAKLGSLAPTTDASNAPDGHFLWLSGHAEGQMWSKTIPRTGSRCLLELALHQMEMKNGAIRLVIETDDTSSVAAERPGNNAAIWQITRFNLGAISQPHRLFLEMVVPYSNSSIAVDNIRLVDCFPESTPIIRTTCTDDMFRCNNGSCLNRTRICDLTADCADGEDEALDCDRIPENARCNFESGWCGWTNVAGRPLNWTLHRGPTPTERTGPSYDHTYRNATGTYAYVNMSKRAEYGSRGTIESPLYNPTPPYSNDPESPYYKSCQVRFFYHQYGVHSGSLGLYLVQVKPHQNHSEGLWWSYGDRSDVWYNQAVALPPTKYRYFLQFEASKGYASKGDVAIDDFSLSPECFGIGVPASVVGDFNYYNPVIDIEKKPEQHGDFVNETVIRISTCGATGRMGPTLEQCVNEYNRTDIELVMPSATSTHEDSAVVNIPGAQRWTAPRGGYYTLIAMGARGGRGSGGMGSTLGSLVRGIIELEKGQQLYFLVGQPGTDACPKSLGLRMHECQQPSQSSASNGIASIVREVKKIKIKDGGGGGGGATYIFKLKDNGDQQPLIIAAGGGGLGLGQFVDDKVQHGKGPAPFNRITITGAGFIGSGGAGGGWNGSLTPQGQQMSSGMPLSLGGQGGLGCGPAKRGHGDGGFGGGGGGCLTGGGGGGYIGGSTGHRESSNGEGGYSYASQSLLHNYFRPAVNQGPGEVFIIPAKSGCGCDFRCVVLDQYLSEAKCLCPPGWHLGNDTRSCIMADESNVAHQTFMILLIAVSIGLLFAFSALCLLLYNRYQHRKALLRRRIVMFGNGTELTALRAVSDTMMTEFNPNYEFAGNLYSFKDLPQIARDNISLVKPLGQGAFGEVYQGVYRYRRDEEHPVAVKTLPSLSTSQAEADFMMEALIMSKFNHPNIVHFIGVSFDKHPRYIVLELLAGGDLKNFLREERPRSDRPTTLSMQDLIMCAFDVANGCKYMEDARFIHRDIAARNCLLTCKGPGRIVKIADFGMARDIYRSDYYRKGGKAMLPIKWMPPESFLDGIFTTKTDVWAFGVLLWEIMSFGYMPYTGCANREVMSMVTSGGRLERPAGCPDPIYGIMTRCWHPRPEERPSFTTIVERIGYCLQDPDVINHPMPNYDILPACEREITIMRPDPETECINVHTDLDACGYMQPKVIGFRPTSYRIGQGSGAGIVYEHDIDMPGAAGPSERIFSRNREEMHGQIGWSSRESDGDGTNNSCNDDNKDDNSQDVFEDESTNDVHEKCGSMGKMHSEQNVYHNTNKDTECRNVSLIDNSNDQLGNGKGLFTRGNVASNCEGAAAAVSSDRKNGNESTTDTNLDTIVGQSSDPPPETSSNSSPNTRTCSPSRATVNNSANSNPNANNVNGMLRKNTLKAALSLDPSALCRGTIPYEKIAFSPPPQQTSNPGSVELRRDSLGQQLPREEKCSC